MYLFGFISIFYFHNLTIFENCILDHLLDIFKQTKIKKVYSTFRTKLRLWEYCTYTHEILRGLIVTFSD